MMEQLNAVNAQSNEEAPADEDEDSDEYSVLQDDIVDLIGNLDMVTTMMKQAPAAAPPPTDELRSRSVSTSFLKPGSTAIKVFTTDGSFKAVAIQPDQTAEDVKNVVCDKLFLPRPDWENYGLFSLTNGKIVAPITENPYAVNLIWGEATAHKFLIKKKESKFNSKNFPSGGGPASSGTGGGAAQRKKSEKKLYRASKILGIKKKTKDKKLAPAGVGAIKSVSITKASMKGDSKGEKILVFIIAAEVEGKQYSFEKSFQDFVKFHSKLKKITGYNVPKFPGKEKEKRLSPSLLEKRRTKLESYLQQIVSKQEACAQELGEFLLPSEAVENGEIKKSNSGQKLAEIESGKTGLTPPNSARPSTVAPSGGFVTAKPRSQSVGDGNDEIVKRTSSALHRNSKEIKQGEESESHHDQARADDKSAETSKEEPKPVTTEESKLSKAEPQQDDAELIQRLLILKEREAEKERKERELAEKEQFLKEKEKLYHEKIRLQQEKLEKERREQEERELKERADREKELQERAEREAMEIAETERQQGTTKAKELAEKERLLAQKEAELKRKEQEVQEAEKLQKAKAEKERRERERKNKEEQERKERGEKERVDKQLAEKERLLAQKEAELKRKEQELKEKADRELMLPKERVNQKETSERERREKAALERKLQREKDLEERERKLREMEEQLQQKERQIEEEKKNKMNLRKEKLNLNRNKKNKNSYKKKKNLKKKHVNLKQKRDNNN